MCSSNIVTRSCHVDQFTFHISLPSLKFTIFIIYHIHDDFNSADPSILQDACQIWTQLNDPAVHEFS